MSNISVDQLDVLVAARKVADFALTLGVPSSYAVHRPTYEHAGALLADAVLQAGLNYQTVVMPRVEYILKHYPDTNQVNSLILVVSNRLTSEYLKWQHPTKIERFNLLVRFLYDERVDSACDLRRLLRSRLFQSRLLALNGVGSKTVDYMACLVGIETVAVDRHIKNFAAKAEVGYHDYNFLKTVFSYAADLLSISRREFDAWVWSQEARKRSLQLHLRFELNTVRDAEYTI